MNLDKALSLLLAPARTDAEAEAFITHYAQQLWHGFNEYRMSSIKELDNNNPWVLSVVPAAEAQAYNQYLTVPLLLARYRRLVQQVTIELEGMDVTEQLGLCIDIDENQGGFSIKGVPTLDAFRTADRPAPGTFVLHVRYDLKAPEGVIEISLLPEGMQLDIYFDFPVHQDTRKLWRNVPVEWGGMSEPKYFSVDEAKECIVVEADGEEKSFKNVVAASKRGRSHAHDGKPRDDNFRVTYDRESGWYVLAVADGAGSAAYSREGSRIACEETVSHCLEGLKETKEFEEQISRFRQQKLADPNGEDELRALQQPISKKIYEVLCNAALEAHNAIKAEAERTSIPLKQYSTTLLLSICKQLTCGWFIATFWVGDGALGLYTRDANGSEIKVLGSPDEGEFGGQTRFLTMPEIFGDAEELRRRLRFCLVDDFTALFLMSDGVSDPKFETDANLNAPEKWDELWFDLANHGVRLTTENEEVADQLLDWLDFWAVGNHDDRTIAILYGDKCSGKTAQIEEQTTAPAECGTEISMQPNDESQATDA